MNTPEQAITFEQSHPQFKRGECLRNVVMAYDVFITPGPSTAAQAYAATNLRGTGTAPLGALLWWLGGQAIQMNGVWVKPGHVAIADGEGGCYSTDFTDAGFVGDGQVHHLSDYRNISSHDPAQVFQAWSRDLNGYLVIPMPVTGQEEDMILFKASPNSTIYALVGGGFRTTVTVHQYKTMVDTLGAKAPKILPLPSTHEWYTYKLVDLSKIAV